MSQLHSLQEVSDPSQLQAPFLLYISVIGLALLLLYPFQARKLSYFYIVNVQIAYIYIYLRMSAGIRRTVSWVDYIPAFPQ